MPQAQRPPGDSVEAQRRLQADRGAVSASDQLAEKLGTAYAGPAKAVITYGVAPALAAVPVLGKFVEFAKFYSDPIVELRKALGLPPEEANPLDPRSGQYYVGKFATNLAVAGITGIAVLKDDFTREVLKGQTVAFDPNLVKDLHDYVAITNARKAEGIRRNPAKYFIGAAWNTVVRGDFLNGLIYKNTALVTRAEAEAPAWYGQLLSGLGVKDASSTRSKKFIPAFVREDRGFWSGPAKVLKGVWQVAGPTAATLAVFPPLAPVVFVATALNFNWGENVRRTPAVRKTDAEVNREIKKFGQVEWRLRDFEGNYFAGGEKFKWHSQGDPNLPQMNRRDKFFQTMDDFFTLRGLQRTFITGETWRIRGWAEEKRWFLNNVITDSRARVRMFYDSQNPGLTTHYFSRRPGLDGMRQSGFNAFEQRRVLPGGETVTTRLRKNKSGKWVYGRKAYANIPVKSFWAGLSRFVYHTQQATLKIGAPLALAVAFPNPLTWGLAAFSTVRHLGSLTESLKGFGWVVKEGIPARLSARQLAHLTSMGLGSKNVLVWFEINGNGFFRKLSRFTYQSFHPFDREVGWLRRAMAWRDVMHARFLSRVTGNRFFGALASNLYLVRSIIRPLLGRLARFGKIILGALLGFGVIMALVRFGGDLVKFMTALLELILGKIDALFWLIVGFITKKIGGKIWGRFWDPLWRKTIGRGLARLMTNLARSLPVGFLRNVVRFFLRRVLSSLRLPGPGLFSRLLNRLLTGATRFLSGSLGRVLGQLAATVLPKLALFLGYASLFLGFLLTFGWMMVVAISLFTVTIGRFFSSSQNDYLIIEKSVVNPKERYQAGDLVEYKIRFKILRPLGDPVFFQDYFLVSTGEGTAKKNYFDPTSIFCDAPAELGVALHDSRGNLAGPKGEWYFWGAKISNPAPHFAPGEWREVNCGARVRGNLDDLENDPEKYTDGELINQAIVLGFLPESTFDFSWVTFDLIGQMPTYANTSVSQWLYLNSSRAEGWPVAHACITQGPETPLFNSHWGQQAIDLASNIKLGENIDQKPVYATVQGKVRRVCSAGSYGISVLNNVCGGFEVGPNSLALGSFMGTGFGTYVLLEEELSGLISLYAHLSRVNVSEGELVEKSSNATVIGFVGSTGNSTAPHLHYAFLGTSNTKIAPPFIPYLVPACENRSSCEQAFDDQGQPERGCF